MTRTIQNSFVSGEISPTLHGRHDLKAYFNGAEELTNFIVRKTGGLQKRAGTDIALDLSAFTGCRVIPFYYDRTRSTLLLFTPLALRFIDLQPDGTLAVTQLDGSDYTVTTAWTQDDIANLKSYQAGDTLFLTCPGAKAQKLVRFSAASWTLSDITALANNDTPPAMSYETFRHEYLATYNAPKYITYALFSVKAGLYSAPTPVTVKTYFPWASSATVTLSFSANLSIDVDSYAIGKKSGRFYGLLAEFEPVLTTASAPVSTTGVSALAPADTHTFSSNHATALALSADPDATTQKEVLLLLNAYTVHIARPTGGGTPAAIHTAATAYALSAVRLWLGGVTSGADKRSTAATDYAATQLTVTLERKSGTTYIPISTTTATPDADGLIEIPVSETATMTILRVSIAPPNAEDTGVICRGIALLNRASTPAYVTGGTWTQVAGPATDYDYFCLGVSGWTSLSANYQSAALTVTTSSLATARASLTTRSCSPVIKLLSHTNASAITVTGGAATVTVLSSSPVLIAEFRIWLGAIVTTTPLYAPGQRDTIPSNTDYVQLKYTTDGTTWTTLAAHIPLSDTYSDDPVPVYVTGLDSETFDAIKGWGLVFTPVDPDFPVVIRGLRAYRRTITGEYVDNNDIPSQIIPEQTFISPGSTAMYVDLICLYQQRLILASSYGLPFSLWLSKLGNIYGFHADKPVTDTDPFSASIPAIRSTRILNMIAEKRLILFTEGGVYTLEGSDSEGLSYRTLRITQVANSGACDVEPVAGQNTVLYVQDDARTLTELSYDLTQDSVIPIDRSVLAAHLTESSPVVRLAWQASPNAVLWALLADGTLLSFTYMPEHQVYAWARHTVAGVDRITDIVSTGSVATSPDTETTSKIYLQATAGGKTLLLRLRHQIASSTPSVAAASCLDSAQPIFVPVTDPPAATVTPSVAYRAGDTVTAVSLADGTLATLTALADGTLSPGLPAGNYLLGIPVSATVKTLRPEQPDRNIQGYRKQVTDTLVRLYRSRSITVVPSDPPGQTPVTHEAEAGDVTEGRVPLFSGDLQTMPFTAWNTDGRLTIQSADPWPCEILSVIQTIELEGR